MCYTIDGLLKNQIRQAKRQGAATDEINHLIDLFNRLSESGDRLPRVHHKASGFASVTIGSGTVQSGTFATINWGAGPYYIKSETDPTGGTSYTISGTQQLC